MSNDNIGNTFDEQQSVFAPYIPTEQERLERQAQMETDFQLCKQQHNQNWLKIRDNQWLCCQCDKGYTKNTNGSFTISTIPPSLRDRFCQR